MDIGTRAVMNISAFDRSKENVVGRRRAMSGEKIIVEISCFEVWRQISDYVDHDVDPELKARLEFHFERCRDCKAILDGTRNIVALIGDDRAFEFPEGVSERLTSTLSQRIANHRPGDE
jgi:hypothetical protein